MMFSPTPTALQYLSTFLRVLHGLAVSGLSKVGLCFQRAHSKTGKLRRFPRDGRFTTYSKGS
jgi:hypothetical protein